jgi:type I restriction enzyme S subunit
MPTNIGDGGIVEEGIARIDQSDVDRLSQHKLQLGDIVFSRRGDVTKNALIREREVGWFCGTGCLKVRLGKEKNAIAKFISHCLRSPEIKDWLVRHAVGATMPNLNTGILSAVPIVLPPLKTQLKISAILDSLDDRITLLRETNATLEAIAQAIFKSWFVDFDPVRAKQEGRAPEGMDEATAALFPDSFEESELGLVPRGWGRSSIGQLCSLTKGCSYKGDGLSEDQGAYMFNLGCFNAPRVFATEKVKRYTGEYKERHMVSAGDLILANTDMTQERAILGRPLLIPEGYSPGFVSHHVFKATPKSQSDSGVLRIYLYFSFLQPAFRDVAVGYATGTTVLALPKDALEKHLLVLAPEENRKLFSRVVKPIIDQIARNIDLAKTLATLRDTLLPRLISGQLRLPDAEDAIAEAVA